MTQPSDEPAGEVREWTLEWKDFQGHTLWHIEGPPSCEQHEIVNVVEQVALDSLSKEVERLEKDLLVQRSIVFNVNKQRNQLASDNVLNREINSVLRTHLVEVTRDLADEKTVHQHSCNTYAKEIDKLDAKILKERTARIAIEGIAEQMSKLLQSLNIQAIVNGQDGQYKVTTRINAAVDIYTNFKHERDLDLDKEYKKENL